MRLVLALLGLLVATVAHAQVAGSSLAITPASSNKNITSAITAPNSTSAFKMQGSAGSITPAVSGTVLITISGTILANTAATNTHGVKYQISYGTSTAPTTNATLTGTQACAVAEERMGDTVTTFADYFTPFSISCLVTGLTVGTTYWIDLAAESVTTASDHGFSNVNISAVEQAHPANVQTALLNGPGVPLVAPQIIQSDISSTNTPGSTADTGDNFTWKPFPQSVQAGDAIVCEFSWVSGVTMSSISDGIGGDTWSTTPAESADNGAGNIKTGLFVLPNSAGGAATMNVVFGTNSSPFQHSCWEINNIATSSPTNGGLGVANVQYPNVDPGSFTPGANTLGNFIISVAALAYVDANQAPSLFTNSGTGCGYVLLEADVANQTGNGFPHASMGCTQGIPAATDPKLTLSGGSTSDFYNVVSVALKIAAAGGSRPSGIHINNLIHLTGVPTGSGTTMALQFPTTGNLRVLQFLTDGAGNATVTDSDGVNAYSYTAGCLTTGNGNCWAYEIGPANPNLVVTIHHHVSGGSSNRFVDIQGANASPYDTSADTGQLNCSSVTTIANIPQITPSGPNELILNYMGIGDGPGTAVTTPSGAIFGFTTYPGQGDASEYDNSDGFGAYYNGSDTTQENWTFSLKSNPSNQCAGSAVAFKP